MGTVGYLLDTHTFLYSVCDESKLSQTVKKAITENPSQVLVSAVSAYEIMNKYRLGKLPEYTYLAENYLEKLHEFGADELLINTQHTHFAGKFEWSHRDPFDRLLVAQAFTENMFLVTNDSVFHSIPWLDVLW